LRFFGVKTAKDFPALMQKREEKSGKIRQNKAFYALFAILKFPLPIR